MPRLVAVDTETHRIGPGKVIPPLVCASFAEEGRDPWLLSTADPELLPTLRELLSDPSVHLTGHNVGGFDLPVACRRYPELEPLAWRALADRRVHDTMLREQLLNLSTHGRLEQRRLPDGSSQRISYSLGELAANYLGLDMEGKDDESDSWRVNYDVLDGLRADQFPPDAREYAREDARVTLAVHLAQAARAGAGDGQFVTEEFQCSTAFALAWITEAGMRVDPAEFRRLEALLAAELSEDRMGPLLRAGILSPSAPPVPHSRQDARAREVVAGWLGILPEDVNWGRLDAGMRQALLDSGIRFKQPAAASVRQAELRRRIVAVAVARALGRPMAEVLAHADPEALAAESGVTIKRTPTGDVSTDKEMVASLADRDEMLAPTDDESPLACFRRRQLLQKLVTTELPRMTWEGEVADVVHFPYRVLVETTRTSSFATDKYPSANGQNVDPRARTCFMPRPGYLLCSCDYSALELVCVAQATYTLFGESVHRDKVNAGVDLHAYLGARLALDLDPGFSRRALQAGTRTEDPDALYRFFRAHEEADPDYYSRWRKFAKPVGLGFPGGLGPWKLCGIAKKQYDVDVVAMAQERFARDPSEFRATSVVEHYARRLHRMRPDEFRWTPELLGIALADRLRQVWFSTYPEMVRYFDWVKGQHDPRNPVLVMPDLDEEGGEREVQGLRYVTPMGALRSGTTFTASANGFAMQSPAAEGFKAAMFDVVRACREGSLIGCRVVNEVHDELLIEVPDDDRAGDSCVEIRRLMESAMATVIRDVRVTAEPCLMRRWDKRAKPVFDERGMLVPWREEKT